MSLYSLSLNGGTFSLFGIGCRGGPSDKPLATNCNACRYVKDAVTGECLRECPDGYKQQDDNTCKSKIEQNTYPYSA